MRNFVRIAVLCALVSTALSCSGGPRVIPGDALSEIYADMFIADQWVQSDILARHKADTTMLYEPIFKKYGFDSNDYLASVDYYMREPMKYSKILRGASDIIERKISILREIEGAKLAVEERERRLREFNPGIFYYYDTSFFNRIDTVGIEIALDSMFRYLPKFENNE